MASTSAALSTASFVTTSIGTRRSVPHRKRTVIRITGLYGYQGLKKVHTCAAASLGVPMTADKSFVYLGNSIKPKSNQKRGRADSIRCNNAANEIFNIVLIMTGLTLVGVAVGFALLRIEAFVEEAEEA